MAAQKVGFTPRPIWYGSPYWHVSSSAALKSALHIRAELETCQLGDPYPRSMQKLYPFWASVSPLCQSTQAFLPSFFPVLDLLVYVLPFLSSTWLPPLLSFISSSSLPLFKLLSSSCKLLPFYLSTFGSIEPRSSREFASISP